MKILYETKKWKWKIFYSRLENNFSRDFLVLKAKKTISKTSKKVLNEQCWVTSHQRPRNLCQKIFLLSWNSKKSWSTFNCFTSSPRWFSMVNPTGNRINDIWPTLVNSSKRTFHFVNTKHRKLERNASRSEEPNRLRKKVMLENHWNQ